MKEVPVPQRCANGAPTGISISVGAEIEGEVGAPSFYQALVALHPNKMPMKCGDVALRKKPANNEWGPLENRG
jgi:hypothetical protein